MHYQRKAKGLLMAMSLMLTLSASGQPKNLELSSDSRYTRPDAGLKCFGSNALFLSARKEEFLNDVFYQYNKEKAIKDGWGIELTYSVVVWSPFALEVTGFYSSYNVEGLNTGMDKEIVQRLGVECFVDAFFLPYVGKISNYFAPYAGIGYQTSSLSWGKDISVGTGSAMYKLGTQIRLGRGIVVRAEYKQSLPKSSNKLFSALDFGIGCIF